GPPPAPAPAALAPRAGPTLAASAPEPDASVPLGPAEGDEAEEEESLLKRTEPDVEQQVIGAKPEAPSTTKAPAPSRPTVTQVSVHVVSRPEGAVIMFGNRVFGRAPMNLRFAPGNTYELSFVKSGFRRTNRRFTVGRRKNQELT